MKHPKSILTAAIALVTLSFVGFGCMSKAYADLIVTYTLSGGTITGTLHETPFSDKSFTMTVNADPDSFTLDSFTLDDGTPVPYAYQPAAPTMTIDGFSPFTITESSYVLVLVNYSSFLDGYWAAGFGERGTADDDSFIVQGMSTGDLIFGPAGIVNGLLIVDNHALTTSAGILSITPINAGATFSSTPIPEPGTWAAMAIFAGGAAYAGWRRRRQQG